MQTITVRTADKPYDIRIGRGLLPRAGEMTRAVAPDAARVTIVTDSHVAPYWLDAARAAYEVAGFAVSTHVFPAGEAHKQLSTAAALYDTFSENGLTRGDLCVALGGGVVGDVAGFAAATWLRGIDFVQIPTSLLAQVDSSVGGKTGVDLPSGKNLVGAFHQPALVLIDPDTLDTLPPVFMTDGYGEIIKMAALFDAALFADLESGAACRPDRVENTVARAVDLKRRVVEEDETERGRRKLLNFGHTVGHALESYYHYEKWLHGAAVAIGCAAVTRASERQGLTETGTAARLEDLLRAYRLPITDPAPASEWLPLIAHDKKRRGDDIDLVYLKEIGCAALHTLPVARLGAFLEEAL